MNHDSAQYYLHENGEIIYKPHGGVQKDSTSVKQIWQAKTIGVSPESYLNWLYELIMMDVDLKIVIELALQQPLEQYIPNYKDLLRECYIKQQVPKE